MIILVHKTNFFSLREKKNVSLPGRLDQARKCPAVLNSGLSLGSHHVQLYHTTIPLADTILAPEIERQLIYI